MENKKLLMPSLSAFFLAIVPLLTSSSVALWVAQHESTIQSFTLTQWFWVSIGCILACALALIPPTFLAFGFGYFLGWQALIPLLIINMSAILLVYMVAFRLNQDTLRQYLEQFPKAKKVLNQVGQNELKFVFFTKLSPFLPFALINLLFALLQLRLKNVIVGGFLGMIPRTALAVWVGMQAHEIRQLLNGNSQSPTEKIVIMVLLMVSVWGLIQIFTKRSA